MKRRLFAEFPTSIRYALRWLLIVLVIRRIGLPLLFMVDRLVTWFPMRTSSAERGIVFIRTDNLGDFILWLPSARALAASEWARGHRLTLVANSQWAALPVVGEIFDEVIPIELRLFRRNLLYRFRLLRRLSRLCVATVVNPIVSRESVTADSLARSIKANTKIAAAPKIDPYPRTLRAVNGWYDRLIWVDGTCHEMTHNQEFVVGLIGPSPLKLWPWLEHDRGSALSLDDRYAVIAPGYGSLSALKSWSAAQFARAADWIAEELGLTIVVTGTAAERDVVELFKAKCTHPVIDRCGTMSLPELIEFVGGASLVVTNETGMAHLGGASRIPTVVILGGGNFGKFLPYPPEVTKDGAMLRAVYKELSCYGCIWRCHLEPTEDGAAPCVGAVTLDDVKQAITSILQCV